MVTSKHLNGGTREDWEESKARSGENKLGKILQGREYKWTQRTGNETGSTAK